MRIDSARLPCNGLRANRDEIHERKKAGVPRRASAISCVHNGPMPPGSIKHLKGRQIALYRLHATMARNEDNATDLISQQMRELQKIFKSMT